MFKKQRVRDKMAIRKSEPSAATIAAKKVAKIATAHSREILEQLVQIGGRMQSLEDTTDNRMKSLEEQRQLLQTSITDRFNHLDKRIVAVKDLLDGNGTPERGVLTRVDRLEQAKIQELPIRVDRLEQDEKRRVWLIRCLIGSTVASVLGVIVELLAKHG
jgi:hypothetical protein